MLFVDVVDAVEAVLEMVLAIVLWLPSECATGGLCGTRGLGGATGEEFKGSWRYR